jgi:hypothetical protein
VDRYTRRPRLARLASAAAGPVVSGFSRERLYRRSERFSVAQPEAFDDRFVKLWEIARDHQGATSERSADLLNWRYEKTGPAAARGDYAVFALVEGTDVAGYIVYRVDGDSRLVYDIVHLPDRSVIDALLSEFILDARHGRAAMIDLGYVGPGNLLSQRLRAFGFLPTTGKNGLRVYVDGDAPFGVDLLSRDSWYFLTGDTDF